MVDDVWSSGFLEGETQQLYLVFSLFSFVLLDDLPTKKPSPTESQQFRAANSRVVSRHDAGLPYPAGSDHYDCIWFDLNNSYCIVCNFNLQIYFKFIFAFNIIDHRIEFSRHLANRNRFIRKSDSSILNSIRFNALSISSLSTFQDKLFYGSRCGRLKLQL